MIRPATLGDVKEMVGLGRSFHLRSGYPSSVPLNERDLATSLRRFIRSPTSGVYVALESGRLVGGAAFSTIPCYFNLSHKMGIEHFLWVSEDARGGRLGADLLLSMEAGAIRRKCTLFCMIALEASMPEKIGRFYERHGYRLVERSYMKTLRPEV